VHNTITPVQRELVNAVSRALEADADIEAAWLGGSLGRGAGDAYSDIDVVALVRDSRATDVGLRYVNDVAKIATTVLVNSLFGGRVLSVVTSDWSRFDVSFIHADELGRYNAREVVPLFNKGRLAPPQLEARPYEPKPEVLLGLVNEFLRVLGLLVVAAGREEWILAMSGTELLRRLTIDMMLEENRVGPADRGGALRRNSLLTTEQRRELESLSPLAANRASVYAASRELCAIFLRRARPLAGRIGMTWPSEFEAATRRHLSDRLGLTIP
jgi:hypothetical protein